KGRLVPYTVFIDPQLGRVGMTETEARGQKRNIRVAKMPMNYVARALEMEESRGFMKVIVDADSQEILGAAILRRGRRNHVSGADCHDGQAALHGAAGRYF